MTVIVNEHMNYQSNIFTGTYTKEAYNANLSLLTILINKEICGGVGLNVLKVALA